MSSRGAPIGNKRAAKGTAVRDSLWKSLKQWKGEDGVKALRKITDTLVEQAMDPESSNYQFAVKEIGLRIDGTPKSDSNSGPAPQVLIGISPAFAGLIAATGGAEGGDGEVIVQDGPVLPVEVCTEQGGHGEGMDIRALSGGAAESQ